MNVVIPREDHTMKVSVLLYSQYQLEKHMWQSHVDYSLECFDYIIAFKAP